MAARAPDRRAGHAARVGLLRRAAVLAVVCTVLAVVGLAAWQLAVVAVVAVLHTVLDRRLAARGPRTRRVRLGFDVLAPVAIAAVAPVLALPALLLLLVPVLQGGVEVSRRCGAVLEVAGLLPLGALVLLQDPPTAVLVLLGFHPVVALGLGAEVWDVAAQRDRARRELARLDDALSVLGATAPRLGTHGAVAAGVRALLPGVERVESLLDGHHELTGAAAGAFERGDPVVEDHAGGVAVAVPVRAGDEVVGAVVVHLGTTPADRDVRTLDVFVDRIASLLLVDAARQDEQRARSEVERAEQLRNDLLARVSHDLRVPVATLAGTARTLADHHAALDPERVARLHEALVRNADRVAAWVGSLLDDATHGVSGSLAPVPLELPGLLDAGVEVSSSALSGHRVAVWASPVSVLADTVAVVRILGNLLHNAARHAPAGSLVEVRSSVEDGHARVTVVDRGPGVGAGESARVFEPGVRGEGGGGAGLGLSTVRDLVGRLGGTVGVEQTPGGGASVWFTLPLVEAPVDGGSPGAATAPVVAAPPSAPEGPAGPGRPTGAREPDRGTGARR